ncbi:hypothetical protein GCM10027167_78730 [Nocardia heshunensis]
MHDEPAALDRLRPTGVRAQIGLDQFDAGQDLGHRGRALYRAHGATHPVPAAEQFLDDMTCDEAGSTGDENEI